MIRVFESTVSTMSTETFQRKQTSIAFYITMKEIQTVKTVVRVWLGWLSWVHPTDVSHQLLYSTCVWFCVCVSLLNYSTNSKRVASVQIKQSHTVASKQSDQSIIELDCCVGSVCMLMWTGLLWFGHQNSSTAVEWIAMKMSWEMSHPPSEQDSRAVTTQVMSSQMSPQIQHCACWITSQTEIQSSVHSSFLLIVLLCHSSSGWRGFKLLTSNRGEARAARLW